VHIKTFEIRLFLFLDLFMSLLLDFCFAFGLFGMIIIFFGRMLIFGNFIGPGFGQVLVSRSGGIFTVLFAFGVGIKGGLFGFEEEIFVTLILDNGRFLFGIGGEVGAALAGVGSVTDFIFGSVIHR